MKILVSPGLEHLSLACALHFSSFDEFLAEKAPSDILPQAEKLELKCSTSEDPAATMLLCSVITLGEVAISFEPAAPDQTVVPYPTFLHAISTLPELQFLTLVMSSRTHFTLSGLSAVVSHERIRSFTMASPNDRFEPMPASVLITMEDLVRTPITFKLL